MHTNQERGVALVLALILMSTMSVLAASLMFLSQTETYATMNYRMMSQARYAGEAGVQKASDFLLDTAQYPIPVPATDPLFDTTACNYQVSPVECGGMPVVLSSGTNATACENHESNYPTPSVVTAFQDAAYGSLASGNANVKYCAYATLVAMQLFDSYGGGPGIVQTWEITGVGSLEGPRPATVEVVAIVEQPKVPANNYAAFATDNTCGALTFDGGAETDSYDSSLLNPAIVAVPTMDQEGGDVGTNGNLNISNNVDIYGNLYTPRTGVGDCSEGSVTAITESGHATVHGGIVPLPTAVNYPTPTIPAPSILPLVDINHVAGACVLLGLTVANCTETGDDVVIHGTNMDGSNLSLPSVKLSGSHVNIVLVATNLPPAQFNFNSIELTANASIRVQATSPLQGVLVNVVGKDEANADIATPIDFTGGGNAAVSGCATCSPFDASMLQFVYGGTGEIKIAGHAAAAAVFYAPEASVIFSGTSDLYGSILASRLRETGSGKIHYDRRLSRDFYVAGHPMVGTFSWKRY